MLAQYLLQINDIQRLHLTEEEYEAIVLRPKYSEKTSIDDESSKKNDTIVDDDGNTYEVFVISEGSNQKPTIDTEFEEFELLEVDNCEVNSQNTEMASIETLQNTKLEKIENANDEKPTGIELMATDEHENVVDNAVISTRTRSQRKSRITTKKDSECEIPNVGRTTRQTTKMKNEMKKTIQNLKNSKKSPIPAIKCEKHVESIANQPTESCEDENLYLKYDGIEGESDDEFPARDSDNEDWPSQETLNDFPKKIIKDGLLQVKGKKLMSMICR